MFNKKYIFWLLILIIVLVWILIFLVIIENNNFTKDNNTYDTWNIFLNEEEIENIKSSLIKNVNSTDKNLNINNF